MGVGVGGALCIKSMDHPEANAALGNSSGSIKTISAGLAECARARKHTRERFVCTKRVCVCVNRMLFRNAKPAFLSAEFCKIHIQKKK